MNTMEDLKNGYQGLNSLLDNVEKVLKNLGLWLRVPHDTTHVQSNLEVLRRSIKERFKESLLELLEEKK